MLLLFAGYTCTDLFLDQTTHAEAPQKHRRHIVIILNILLFCLFCWCLFFFVFDFGGTIGGLGGGGQQLRPSKKRQTNTGTNKKRQKLIIEKAIPFYSLLSQFLHTENRQSLFDSASNHLACPNPAQYAVAVP